jgi:hypothetical protein
MAHQSHERRFVAPSERVDQLCVVEIELGGHDGKRPRMKVSQNKV